MIYSSVSFSLNLRYCFLSQHKNKTKWSPFRTKRHSPFRKFFSCIFVEVHAFDKFLFPNHIKDNNKLNRNYNLQKTWNCPPLFICLFIVGYFLQITIAPVWKLLLLRMSSSIFVSSPVSHKSGKYVIMYNNLRGKYLDLIWLQLLAWCLSTHKVNTSEQYFGWQR